MFSDQGKRDFSVIKYVKTPLGFLALCVLVIESVLGVLAWRAEGEQLTYLIFGIIAGFIFLLIIFYKLYGASPTLQETRPHFTSTKSPDRNFPIDVFVSSPMAGMPTEASYQELQERTTEVVRCLSRECGFSSVLYAGRDMPVTADFEPPDYSVSKNLQDIQDSRFFILIYPEKLISSVIVEAAWAIAFGKPSVFFVRNSDDLPFLLRQASSAFDFVRTYEFRDFDDIRRIIARQKERLFHMSLDT